MNEYRDEATPKLGEIFEFQEGFHEKLNFFPIEGMCLGCVQVPNGGDINIGNLGAAPDAAYVDGVTVIWTATEPRVAGSRQSRRLVVGWHRNAKVFRKRQFTSDGSRTRVNREGHQENIEFYIQASAFDCTLVAQRDRDIEVPRMIKGAPGISSLFYPDAENENTAKWLPEVIEAMEDYERVSEPTVKTRAAAGWPVSPDTARNAEVEAIAISLVVKTMPGKLTDRQTDNCGWDLEFLHQGVTTCIEVKGLSGIKPDVQLTPNEFATMTLAMRGGFENGGYRLAVVTNALNRPKLHLFAHASGDEWRCEISGQSITVQPIIAARLS